MESSGERAAFRPPQHEFIRMELKTFSPYLIFRTVYCWVIPHWHMVFRSVYCWLVKFDGQSLYVEQQPAGELLEVHQILMRSIDRFFDRFFDRFLPPPPPPSLARRKIGSSRFLRIVFSDFSYENFLGSLDYLVRRK